MPSRVTIRCLAAYTADAEEAGGGLVPLFVGRDDGTVERYDAMQDAELGIPTLAFYAHRKAVTGIVAISPQELYTCSLDGTVKQWTLEEADDPAASAAGAAGAHTRAALVKTSTFPFGVRTMIEEGTGAAAGQQRLFLGGEDGSLTLMEGERRSSWPAHDGGALTAIAVDTNNSGCVLTGGTDGLIYVWDMESGRPVCELSGHTGAIAALSVVAVPASIPVVRAKREVADGAEAAPLAASAVKDVLVFADAEDNGGGTGAATCLVSCAQDGTVKVWLLPELHEAAAEADLMEQQQHLQQQLRKVSGESTPGQRRSVGISFQEPSAEDSATELTAAGAEGAAAAAEAKANADAAPAHDAVDESGSPTQTEHSPNSPVYNAKLHFLQQQTSATAWKSALKAPERRTVPVHAALGTVELPHTPYTCSSPSAGGDGDEMDGGSGAAAALLYIGAAQGHVYGLKDRLLVKEVCQHTAHNFQKVQQEVRSVQRTLKDGVKVYTKAAAAAMKAAEAKELKIAAQARKAKLAQEAAAKKKEAEERRAARRAAAAAAAAERSDDDEEGEEEEEGEFFDDDGEEEAEEEAEEEPEEAEEEQEAEEEEAAAEGEAEDALEGVLSGAFAPAVAASAPRSTPRRPASWKKLTEEQRAALETLFTAQEKERDERVAALQKAVEAHLAQLQPLAKTPYHRSRGQFANLPYTTSGCVRGGSAVVSLVSATRVPKYDKVYVAQGNAVTALSVQFGVTKL